MSHAVMGAKCLLIIGYLIFRSSGAAAAFGNPATDSTSDDADDSNEDDESSQEGLYSFYLCLLWQYHNMPCNFANVSNLNKHVPIF